MKRIMLLMAIVYVSVWIASCGADLYNAGMTNAETASSISEATDETPAPETPSEVTSSISNETRSETVTSAVPPIVTTGRT